MGILFFALTVTELSKVFQYGSVKYSILTCVSRRCSTIWWFGKISFESLIFSTASFTDDAKQKRSRKSKCGINAPIWMLVLLLLAPMVVSENAKRIMWHTAMSFAIVRRNNNAHSLLYKELGIKRYGLFSYVSIEDFFSGPLIW